MIPENYYLQEEKLYSPLSVESPVLKPETINFKILNHAFLESPSKGLIFQKSSLIYLFKSGSS